jgi:hypothetical protein
MLLLVTLVAAAATSPQPIGDMPIFNPKVHQPLSCPATSRYEASHLGKTPRAQKLNELPDADVYSAVYRRIGKCEAPIVVRYGVSRR